MSQPAADALFSVFGLRRAEDVPPWPEEPATTEPKKMRVYITRDALTRGVRMAEGSLSRFGGMFDPADKADAYPARRFTKDEWATTREEAEKQVARKFRRERDRLKRQLAALDAVKKAGVKWEEP